MSYFFLLCGVLSSLEELYVALLKSIVVIIMVFDLPFLQKISRTKFFEEGGL